MDWPVWMALGVVAALPALRVARTRRAGRAALLAPVQRAARIEGWGGPLLARNALEWRRRDDVVRLTLTRRPPRRVGEVAHWAAQLVAPRAARAPGPDALAALAEAGSTLCDVTPGATRLVLQHVIDSGHLVAFVRAAFPLFEPAPAPAPRVAAAP